MGRFGLLWESFWAVCGAANRICYIEQLKPITNKSSGERLLFKQHSVDLQLARSTLDYEKGELLLDPAFRGDLSRIELLSVHSIAAGQVP